MRTISFSLTLFIFSIGGYGQSKKQFVITDTLISIDFKQVQENLLVSKDSVFFEDEYYTVQKTCSGEWGGSVWFRHKKTGIEYSCESTCPVVINKLAGKYIVTNTLAHLLGSSEILEIADPESMEIFKMPKPRSEKGKTVLRYVGDDESKSKTGSKILVDSIGILTIASFPHNEQIFHIITDFKKTYLASVENEKFISIDTISNQSIWTYNPEVIKTKDEHYIVFFGNKDTKGYLDIYKNQINLYRVD